MSYQLFKNGIPVPRAINACLCLASVAAGYAANYTVAVGNPSGTIVSSAAILTVVDPHMYSGITIDGIVWAQYRIDYSTAANPASFTPLTTITLPSTPYVYIDYSSPGVNARYYRVVKLP